MSITNEIKEAAQEYMAVNVRAAGKSLKCRQPLGFVPEFRLILLLPGNH